MNKTLKLILIYVALVLTGGLFFSVLFGFALNIFYEETRLAFIHGTMLGMVSAFVLAVYEFISGFIRRTFLDQFLTDEIDEK